MAPECEMKATSPGTGGGGARKVVSSGRCVSSRPMQLGPMSRILSSRAMRPTSASSAAPSAPTSRKPPEAMTAARMPRAPQARSASSTMAAGTTMTARSTGSGMSTTLRYAERPISSPPRGFTRWMAPRYPDCVRLRATPKPSFTGSCEAPMTAMPVGWKNGCSVASTIGDLRLEAHSARGGAEI